MAKRGTKSWEIEETTLHKNDSSAVLSTWKRKGKKKKYHNTRYLYLVTQPSTNGTEHGLTLLSGLNISLFLWYGDSTLNAFFKISKMRKGIKKRKKALILHGWEQIIRRVWKWKLLHAFIGDRTSGTFLTIALVSLTKITCSRQGPITLWMFSTVLHLLMYSLTGNRNFARKEELIYETIAAIITYSAPAFLGDSTCAVLPSDIYGTKIPFPRCTVIIWWEIGILYISSCFIQSP